MTENSAAGRRPEVVLRSPGDGELLSVGRVEHLFQVTGSHTGGRFACEEFTVAPGTIGVRPHIHAEHDEYFYVLEGELMLHTGEREIVAGPGSFAAVVRGAPHGYRNAGSTTTRALCMYTPAGYEGYFRDAHAAIAAGASPTEEMLAGLRARYATRPYEPRKA